MRARALQRAVPPSMAARLATIRSSGGFTFAERPELEAPDARIIWRAEIDPGALEVSATLIDDGHPDAIDPAALSPWLTIVGDEAGEHAVLSDGWNHIRIDIAEGSLANGRPVLLRYCVQGIASLEPKLLPLRRLYDLCRNRRFAVSLYPADRRVERWILALRVHDAMMAGASQREIVAALFGADAEGARQSDSMRSRVRRLSREAKALAVGGYRLLMRGRAP